MPDTSVPRAAFGSDQASLCEYGPKPLIDSVLPTKPNSSPELPGIRWKLSPSSKPSTGGYQFVVGGAIPGPFSGFGYSFQQSTSTNQGPVYPPPADHPRIP